MDGNGNPWAADDFQPQTNIKKLVSEGALSSNEEIKQFSRKFAVEPELIKAYIDPVQDLKILREIRVRGALRRKTK